MKGLHAVTAYSTLGTFGETKRAMAEPTFVFRGRLLRALGSLGSILGQSRRSRDQDPPL